MMNYIWAGLILVSIVFALGHDVHDEITDRYQNDKTYELEKISTTSTDSETTLLHAVTGSTMKGRLIQADGELAEIEITNPDEMPDGWQQHYPVASKAARLQVVQSTHTDSGDEIYTVSLPPVHLKRLENMMQAGFDMAEFAAKLALGLIGLMSLWLGMMKIAEQSGLVDKLVRVVRPVLKPLFPEIPDGHPALGAISLNLSANILGLGNAATPLGIKAMQHLQDLNKQHDTASNSMCMFLALNTSSVQLLPPVTVIALLGVNAGGLFLSIFLATLCSTIVAIIAARWYARRNAGKALAGESD